MSASAVPGRRRRAAVFILMTVSLVSVLAACSKAKVGAEGRLDPDGRVVLTRDDKPTTVADLRSLEPGDKIEVAEGSAKVELPGGDVLELRPRSVLVLARGPELRSGSMLVTTTADPRTVRAVGNQVDAQGIVRIDVTLAVRVVAYAGRASIRSGGRSLDVPALREASVPVIGVLPGTQAMAVDANDPWDRRLLGDVADKLADVESRARGFSGQVSASNAASPAYYRGLLPGLAGQPAFTQAEVDRLGRAAVESTEQTSTTRFRAGDVLFGAAVALEGRRGTFAERLAGAAAFRGEGAPWTLVALDQQVPSISGLIRLIDDAVNVAPLELAAPGAPQIAPAATEPLPARPTPTTRPAARTTSTTRPARQGAPTTTTTPPPQPQLEPPTGRPPLVQPLDPILDATVDPVASLLNDLLGNG